MGLCAVEVLIGNASLELRRPQENLGMSQSFVSDLISSKQSSHRVSCNLRNILPEPTVDHLSSTTIWVTVK